MITRIKFFRNKVVEHWDEYLKVESPMDGFVQQQGKAPIPAIEVSAGPEQRRELLRKLKHAFLELGSDLDWPDDSVASFVSTRDEYAEAVYRALDGIDGVLTTRTKRHDPLIELLWQFGFPKPIADIEEYNEALESYLRGHLTHETLLPSVV